jgi:Tfp pilus assembly protein FimT
MLTHRQSHLRHLTKSTGYFGIELLEVIVPILFMLMLGLPFYLQLIESDPHHLLLNTSLASHLEYARQRAMHDEVTVTICPSRDGRNCLLDGDWSQGWLIFTDDVSPSLHLSVGDTFLHRQTGSVEEQALVAAMNVIQYQADGSIRLN